MRIGIDARLFRDMNYTGIPRSVHEILKVWSKKYPDNDYYLFSRRTILLDFDLPDNWHIVNTPWLIDKQKLWSFFKLPKLIRDYNLDLYWGTNYTLPRKMTNCTKFFITIYDLALLKFKGIGTKENILRVKFFAKNACKKADTVITISNATARDVHEIFKVPLSKIEVSYCGGLPIEYKVTSNVDIQDVNQLLVFPEKYFLFISTIEPRKNILTIVKAFEKFKTNTNSDMKLVLAGKKGWNCDNIYQYISESNYKQSIVMPGFISDVDKAYLLINATAFVYPSLYEGFGIPILEAFAYGIPVLTSNVSSMPEVGGNAALYIDDPFDENSLEHLMEYVCTINSADMKLLKERIQKQYNQFSWEKNADEIMEIFQKRV